MRSAKKYTLLFAKVAGTSAFLKISSLAKCSFILGSWKGFFSGSSIGVPLVGAFVNPVAMVAILGLRFLLFGTLSLKILAHVVPGLCAATYWQTESIWFRVVLPLLCMLTFVTHPVGGQAFWYSFYWFVPVVLYFLPQKTLFRTAIGSTFVAHAMGSVIWLYTVPMTAAMWQALVPVVLIERLLFASGMVIVYSIVSNAQSVWKIAYTYFKNCFVSVVTLTR